MRHPVVFALIAVALAVSCTPTVPISRDKTLRMINTGLRTGLDVVNISYDGSQPVLAGTHVCAALQCSTDAGCKEDSDGVLPEVTACFDATVTGAAVADGSPCITFQGSGAVTWDFTPVADPSACEHATYTPVADGFDLTSIDAAEVGATIAMPLEALAVAVLDDTPDALVQPDKLPDDWLLHPADTVRFAPGPPHFLPIALTPLATPDQPVAFLPSDLAIEGADAGAGARDLDLKDGDTAEVGVRAFNDAVDFGTVHVESAQPSALELAVFKDEKSDTFYVRALSRDSDDHIVLGAETKWEVTAGSLAFDSLAQYDGRTPVSDTEDPPRDVEWVSFVDHCTAPPRDADEKRTAEITATVGGEVKTATLTWTAKKNAERKGFVPDKKCEGPGAGCACSSAGEGARGAPWALAVASAVALRALRRRR